MNILNGKIKNEIIENKYKTKIDDLYCTINFKLVDAITDVHNNKKF